MKLEKDKTLIERWVKWDQDNPKFYELFKRFTFEAIQMGHLRLSAWLVTNRIRWESSITTVGEDYKVPNDFIALYSRKFMREFPEHDGFFRVKKMKRVIPAA